MKRRTVATILETIWVSSQEMTDQKLSSSSQDWTTILQVTARLVTLQVESGGLWESAEDFPVEVTFDDMLNSLKDVLRYIGNMDKENVGKTFEEMRKNNRYQEDIFG